MSMLHVDDDLGQRAPGRGNTPADSLFGQIEAAAAEGAQPPIAYAAGTITQPDHWGWWLLAGALLAVLASLCITHWRA